MAAQDDMVRPREVDHLKGEHFEVVVAHTYECDRQSNLPEGDKLLAQDHSVEKGVGCFSVGLG
jgi:hypothetical protein